MSASLPSAATWQSRPQPSLRPRQDEPGAFRAKLLLLLREHCAAGERGLGRVLTGHGFIGDRTIT
jgi:hypothetical protein